MVLEALSFPRVALKHRDLLRSFVWRDLASRYEGSVLGKLLPFVYPLLLLALYHLVFAQFLGLKFGKNPLVGGGWSTTFYLLSGILPWLLIADTMARGTNVILDNSNLIKKIAFPSELLPAFVVLSHLVQFLISLSLFLVLYLVVVLSGVTDASLGDGLRLCANLLYLPVPIALQIVFCVGLAMILATANVFIRDITQVVSVFILMWMLVSPIFYPDEMVLRNAAEKDALWMVTALRINPVYHLLAMYRSAIPRGWEVIDFPWDSCAIFAAVAAALFVLGHGLFVKCKGLFPDEV